MKKGNKINILFLIDMFNGPKNGQEKHVSGGTEKHLVSLSRGLDKERFNCLVCFFEGNNILADLLEKEGIPVIPLHLKRLYEFKAFLILFKLRKIIKKNRIDIVQTYHFKSDTYGVLISRFSGVSKIISSRRDTGDLKTPRQTLLNGIMNRFIDRFIMVCDRVNERVCKSEGIDSGQTKTIYNGIDSNRFLSEINQEAGHMRRRLKIYGDSFILGTIAVFRPEKSYPVLLEGVKKVAPYLKNWKVLLIGDGPTYEQSREYCEENHLNDIVIFTGYVRNVGDYLNIIDLFCLIPERNEGFSNSILEAMVMGKPVIATDVGGNSEAVLHDETGLIIPSGDPERFAEAVMTLYDDPEKRIEMGRRARKRVEERFNLRKMIEEHEKLYEEILMK